MKKADIKRPTRMETAVIKRPTISYICLYRDIVTTELLVDNAGKKRFIYRDIVAFSTIQTCNMVIFRHSYILDCILKKILGLHLEKD
jgi:hypothetical protein